MNHWILLLPLFLMACQSPKTISYHDQATVNHQMDSQEDTQTSNQSTSNGDNTNHKQKNLAIAPTPAKNPQKSQKVTQTLVPSEQLSPDAIKLKQALTYFKAKDWDQAKQAFQKIQTNSPNNAISHYYLGLIALEQDNPEKTIQHWEKYVELAPKEAEKNDVPSNLAFLKKNNLDKEVKTALDLEAQMSEQPPEPNSVAVFSFNNKSDKKYNAFAKGITALVITDLSKVPNLKVLERQKMQYILNEIALSKTKLTDEKTMIRAGKIMKAEKLIFSNLKVDEK